MPDVVTKFRRAPNPKPAPKPRRWSLALTCLGAIIVTGFIGLQAIVFVKSFGHETNTVRQDSTPLAPANRVGAGTGDVMTTGATSVMAQSYGAVASGSAGFTAAEDTPWLLWLETMGFGGACGLVVYIVLIKFFPGISDRGSEFDISSRRRKPHAIGDNADDRRHLGGPIRN